MDVEQAIRSPATFSYGGARLTSATRPAEVTHETAAGRTLDLRLEKLLWLSQRLFQNKALKLIVRGGLYWLVFTRCLNKATPSFSHKSTPGLGYVCVRVRVLIGGFQVQGCRISTLAAGLPPDYDRSHIITYGNCPGKDMKKPFRTAGRIVRGHVGGAGGIRGHGRWAENLISCDTG